MGKEQIRGKAHDMDIVLCGRLQYITMLLPKRMSRYHSCPPPECAHFTGERLYHSISIIDWCVVELEVISIEVPSSQESAVAAAAAGSIWTLYYTSARLRLVHCVQNAERIENAVVSPQYKMCCDPNSSPTSTQSILLVLLLASSLGAMHTLGFS